MSQYTKLQKDMASHTIVAGVPVRVTDKNRIMMGDRI